jgi:nitrate reductase assembly molybdenum cofactor insertion protein NarJ
VLEYAAIADPVDGPVLLQEYRASIELLRFALIEADTPYAGRGGLLSAAWRLAGRPRSGAPDG